MMFDNFLSQWFLSACLTMHKNLYDFTWKFVSVFGEKEKIRNATNMKIHFRQTQTFNRPHFRYQTNPLKWFLVCCSIFVFLMWINFHPSIDIEIRCFNGQKTKITDTCVYHHQCHHLNHNQKDFCRAKWIAGMRRGPHWAASSIH